MKNRELTAAGRAIVEVHCTASADVPVPPGSGGGGRGRHGAEDGQRHDGRGLIVRRCWLLRKLRQDRRRLSLDLRGGISSSDI